MTITFQTDIAGAMEIRKSVWAMMGKDGDAKPLIDAIDAAIRAENEREKEALESL